MHATLLNAWGGQCPPKCSIIQKLTLTQKWNYWIMWLFLLCFWVIIPGGAQGTKTGPPTCNACVSVLQAVSLPFDDSIFENTSLA